MKIIFLILFSLSLPIALLLFTGHPGAAEKVTAIVFLLLALSIVWSLLKRERLER